MELYNSVINKIEGILDNKDHKHYLFNENNCWSESSDFELIMARDAAYELGGSSKPTANCTCITSSDELIDKDEVIVYGQELNEIKEDVSYARIAILKVDDKLDSKELDNEKLFRAIQKIDFVKYHVFPLGFMARTSALSNNEQVRISKKAIDDGISFEKIGNTFIKRYKEVPGVKNAKIIFIANSDIDFNELRACAKSVVNTTKALSKIMEGMPTDCHACSLKPICDEVEGMRELHFGKAKEK